MKIKSFIYTLLMMVIFSLLPTGCSDDIDTITGSTVDDGKVRLRIGLTLPEAQTAVTRAFNRTDFEFDDLHVAVFVKQGDVYFLEEFVRAESPAPEWHETSNETCPGSNHWDFGVVLSKTDTPRRLHFIANYPGLTMGLGEEGNLIGRLVTDESIDGGQHDVYWNYLDVDSIQDGTQEQLRDIPLVRNFTKVEIKVEPKDGVDLNSKFQLLGYAMHNVPTKGTVAPYNSANGTFANYVVKNAGVYSCQSYDNLEQTQGYVGNEPYDNELINLTDFIGVGEAFYMYERTHVNVDDPTCMIIKGKYRTDTNVSFDNIEATYYKLDFIHRDNNTNTNVYYNMLRNFVYTMNIVDVTGEGYGSPEEAIKNPASNNISGNANIDDFTNISDGAGRLFVSTTYLVFTDENPIDIYYRYIPDINNPTVINNNLKGVSGGEIIVTAKQDVTKVLANDAVVASADETKGHVGWRKVTLTPNPPPSTNEDYVRTQDITIASNHLQRKITLVMRNPYEMSVNVVNPNNKIVAKQVKAPVDLKVTIPGGMPMSLFPLKFYVSSERNSIYAKPGGDMYSESYAGGYGFVKEISWEFYRDANSTGTNAIGEPVGIKEADGRISFTCNLVTNCTESATDVYVDNEYFKRGVDGFDNEWKESVSIGNTINVDIQKNNGRYPERTYKSGANNGTQTVSFTYNGNPYTITIDNDNVTNGVTLQNNAGIDPSTKLTFTFSDKYYAGRDNWSSQPVTYTATCTIRQLIAGTTLNFTATTPVDIIAAIDANVGVEIQKLNSRYPQTIANGNNKEVTINMGDIEVGTVNINSNSVTTKPIELINDNGIKDSDLLTFTFSDKYYVGSSKWSDQPVTYTATCTVAQLKSGTTLMFNAPSGIKTTVLEITKDNFSGVTVQQDNGAYPRNIFNGTLSNNRQYYTNPQNNGTETVTVSYNNVDVGSIIINSNSVTAINGSIEISINDLDDKIVFSFTDYYCNRTSNNNTRYYFNNQDEYSTQEFTLEELINGKIELNFTR